ncbi:glycoside hydrolase family 30 protein [Clostridium oryzae]|uniref:Glucuronoxylanase XynC n=1 Tax=Clostridium oryzae TaxID=1450648 RepID=A0A1V4I9T0_9CLOT|nr:glycoside hydrolase family 30 protein [Clostridium oryzae]OPJ56706.1 glucuronoxylanase XynC precursor [Clostridium oryzae]
MKNVKVIQTAKDTTDRLTEKESLKLNSHKADGNILEINPSKTFQQIIGFGGAFTESSAYTFYRMSEQKRNEIIEKYFDSEKGLAYSIGRVHIHSCDFALGNYTYVEDNDRELRTFTIEHEKKWTIPFIKEAEKAKGSSIKLLASPWSPPAWMKTNGDMNHGGKLLPECAPLWAKYYTKYIKAARNEGLDIRAITVQNEPAAVQTWDSCIYSAEEERDFLRKHLGPTMEKEGLSDIKIYIWDHNRDIIVNRAKGVLEDAEATKYVYGISNHWYVSEEFCNLTKVHELFPDKHILFSEGCQEGGVHLNSWETGERYGRNMIGDFNNWQEGWLDWNLILDETGGPNHVGNLCDAPIIADTKKDEVIYNSSYYYIGQFSKYIKPGAKRIEVLQQGKSALENAAFVNKDESIVVIVLNETDNEESFNLKYEEESAQYAIPAHGITTFII